MNNSSKLFCTALIFFCSYGLLQAADNPLIPKAVHWWELVAGIIAIPAALLGLYYTFHLSQKVRLESRKLEIDIEQADSKEEDQVQTSKILKPIITTRIQDYVIRFIILELSIRGWSLIVGVFSPLVAVLVHYLGDLQIFEQSRILGTLAQATISTYITGIGYWLLFLFIGLPLLRDISTDLGLSLRELLRRTPKD